MGDTYKVILLVSRPRGSPSPDNFKIVQKTLPSLNEGELLVQTLFISVDPGFRNLMSKDKDPHIEDEMSNGMPLNEPMKALAVGRVIQSKSSAYSPGDIVTGLMQWAEKIVISEKQDIRKVPKNLRPEQALNEWGVNGMTAYFGITYIGEIKETDNVLVSAAAGATGSIAGQIAKIKGCKVVGIAGGDEKCNWITKELGFDQAINYKKEKNLSEAIKASLSKGADLYYDNVGGETLDAVFPNLTKFGRIVSCGSISQYNLTDKDRPVGPRHEAELIYKSLKQQGFIVSDFKPKYDEALKHLGEWIEQGKIKSKFTVVDGLENVALAWELLFAGKNFGKLIVRVADNSDPQSKVSK